MTNKKTKLGLWTATALVVGNMIGSGVFLSPSALAVYGPISLSGWVLAGLGTLSLAFVFSQLSKKMKDISGGPYTYSRIGLGDFAGFLVAWGYWISIWCTNAAITIAMVGYMGYFIPILNTNPVVAVVTGLTILWGVSYANTRGVRTGGIIQLVTTILKISPLLLVGGVGLFYMDLQNFTPINISGESHFSAITAAATFALFSFLGIESATIPAADVENQEKNIPLATYIGLGISFLVYMIGSVAIMGMIPANELMTSPFPYATAAEIMWGSMGGILVAFGAVVSTFGALNGWILLQGQVPAAIAVDKLFPEIFARKNNKGVPAIGLLISSIFVTILMMMNYTEGLVQTFSFFILLSTCLVLVPYLFSAASYAIILLEDKAQSRLPVKLSIAAIAFLFSLWAVIGSGEKTVFYGFILLILGIPVYVSIKKIRKNK